MSLQASLFHFAIPLWQSETNTLMVKPSCFRNVKNLFADSHQLHWPTNCNFKNGKMLFGVTDYTTLQVFAYLFQQKNLCWKWHQLNKCDLYWKIFPLIIWLASRAGRMNQMVPYDWLPEQARWSHHTRSGLPAVSRKKHFPESHIINPLLTKFVRSRLLDIGYWFFFCGSTDLDFGP